MATSAFISLGSWLLGKIADKGFDKIASKLKSDRSLSTKFNKIVKSTCKKMEKQYPRILGSDLAYFFTDETVFTELFKLLFKGAEVNIKTIENNFDIVTLPKELIIIFINSLKEELRKDLEFNEIFADNELYVSFLGLASDVSEMVDQTKLSREELIKIRELLEKQYETNFNLQNFIIAYYRNMLNNFSQLNFIGLGVDSSVKRSRKKLQDIFVKPEFKIIDKKISQLKVQSNTVDSTIHLSKIFEGNKNLIILGKPGAGKSLLIKYIICNIIDRKKIFSNKNILEFIPFRIELRKYLSYKKENKNPLVPYIINNLELEFGVTGLSINALESILNSTRTLLFFDGLDEIFDINDKIFIKNDIENFHNVYPNVKSVVTSRIIGYEEAQLNDELFTSLEMLDFNSQQIKKYVENWYKQEETDKEIRNKEINEFLIKRRQLDQELVSNPLLLSLIVILYRNNLKIPDSKLEIYQCCTKTLVDKWDAIKNLEIKLNNSILQKKEAIFADIAFWQYESISSNKVIITNKVVQDVVADFLVNKKLADEDNCNLLAEDFLNYAQKRSIYFDNNFTHKTFWEYYTAFWIYSNIEKKHKLEKRNKLIDKYIINSFWYIVLELLLNMIDKDQPDSDIVDDIYQSQISNIDAFPFLLYVLPTLKNISEELVIQVYRKMIATLINRQFLDNLDKDNLKRDLFVRLFKNSSLMSQKPAIIKAFNSINDRTIEYFILITELSFSFFDEKINSINFSEILNSKSYQHACKQDPYLFQRSLSGKEKYFSKDFFEKTLEYIDLFGTKRIFEMRRCYYDTYYVGAFVNFYLIQQFNQENISTVFENLDILESKSLTKISLISYLKRDEPRLFFIKAMKILGEYAEKTSDEKLKVLFMLLIRQSVYRNQDINGLFISDNLKKILKYSYNRKKSFYNYLLEMLDIQDKELIQLKD